MRRFGKVKKTGIRALTVLLIAALVIPQAILALGDGSDTGADTSVAGIAAQGRNDDSINSSSSTSLENAGGGGAWRF
jgi:hypothetical protein